MDKKNRPDIIDEDLYEEFDDEELYELVQEERRKAIERAKQRQNAPKRPFPKWAFWLIAFVMAFNVLALIPQTYSIPALEFLKTSARLSLNEDIQTYKEAVVVIESEDNKGTGFSISEDGFILTNAHVIENKQNIVAAFPKHGLFEAEVMESYPSIDLAVLKVEGENLPYLTLAEEGIFEKGEEIQFIGNPLRFNGIANEGNIIDHIQLKDWDEKVVMIEAPVYRGNSGSPILNKDGEVIGVIFATIQNDTHGKVGLFVPIDLFYHYRSQ